jgi:hypothetical protein
MAVHVGDIYDSGRQGLVLQNIQQFFASRGIHEGIVSKIMLDYRILTARIHYRFFDGPAGPKESMNWVDNSLCGDRIQELNLTAIDQTRAFTCFDESLAREDALRLRESGLFQSVDFHVGGEEGARRVMVEIRGKPIVVNDVSVIGYGSLPHGTLSDFGELPLQAGSIYRNSSARETARYLARTYHTTDKEVEVVPSMKRVAHDRVSVIFSILVYDLNELYIDGELVHKGGSVGSY